MTHRTLLLSVLSGFSLLIVFPTLATVIHSLAQKGEYSHIFLIPAISSALIYRERDKVLANVQTSFVRGMSLVASSLILSWAGTAYGGFVSPNDKLSVSFLTLVIFWIGCFVICYGVRAARAALFPLLFLLLMVPLPDIIISNVVHFLQKGSAEVAYFLFGTAGVPVLQKGLVFSLPGIEIEVASECSGIRSSIALFITSLVLGHWYLNETWKKLLLTILVVPIVVLRNGLRIFTLATLGIYVNPSYLHGPLHHRGGIVFYVLSLLVLLPLLKMLQSSGQRPHCAPASSIGFHGN